MCSQSKLQLEFGVAAFKWKRSLPTTAPRSGSCQKASRQKLTRSLCEHSSTPLWETGPAEVDEWLSWVLLLKPSNSFRTNQLSQTFYLSLLSSTRKRINQITQLYLLNPPTVFQLAEKPFDCVFDWFIPNIIQHGNGAAIHIQLVFEVLQIMVNSCTICTHHANLQNLGQREQFIPRDLSSSWQYGERLSQAGKIFVSQSREIFWTTT